MIELFNQGGAIMLLIAGVSIIAWLLALKTWRKGKFILNDLERKNQQKENRILFESELAKLEGVAGFLAVLAAALPLMGLLGTVLGMLVTFNVIQRYGTGQPALLSNGIRQALLTTQAGLLAALPVLFFHHIILSTFRKIDSKISLVFHKLETVSKNNNRQKRKS